MIFDITKGLAAVRRKAVGTMLEQHKDGSRSQAQPEQRLRLDLPQKAERLGSVSAERTGGKITWVSHREPLGGCGDGKLGNLGRS
jgi:hypothetical protein